ncbi:hypothetical protein OsJ_05744 [Oryza sativa Japonica Group]|nr:hypothetical protein OsJ_05744 [Oryza sativa Japonica Group]
MSEARLTSTLNSLASVVGIAIIAFVLAAGFSTSTPATSRRPSSPRCCGRVLCGLIRTPVAVKVAEGRGGEVAIVVHEVEVTVVAEEKYRKK